MCRAFVFPVLVVAWKYTTLAFAHAAQKPRENFSVKRVLRNRLNDLLLEAFTERDSRVALQVLVAVLRASDRQEGEPSGAGMPVRRLQDEIRCSPAQAVTALQCLAAPPAIVVITGTLQEAGEIALTAAVRAVRQECSALIDAYLAAVDSFARLPPPRLPLGRAFQQARICFNSGLFFEAHEILEGEWSHLERGPLRTFLQGLIQISVGFHHARRGSFAGTVNQLGKGLEKLRRTLAEFPDPIAEEFERAVWAVRERLLTAGRDAMKPLCQTEVPRFPTVLPVYLSR